MFWDFTFDDELLCRVIRGQGHCFGHFIKWIIIIVVIVVVVGVVIVAVVVIHTQRLIIWKNVAGFNRL